jgi:hypothetical protein
MKKTLAIIGTVSVLILASLFLALSSQAQTVNMGRTYVSSQNVRYANEAGTGTTLNKLAKLTGAPSTAILTAITDTSGIVGIVVAGAGTMGSADIAFKGKASCVFDSATTAGHYVTNDTSTAGDCMDAGATYPTSGQVIGVVTSTNGGAGTYEVDLTLGQPQAGGAGGGATIGSGTYAALPATCNAGDAYIPTDSAYDILRCNPADTWNHYRDGRLLTPPVLADFAWINQGGATAVNTYGGVYLSAPAGAGDNVRLLKKAAPGTPYTITAAFIPNLSHLNYSQCGLAFRESGSGKLSNWQIMHDSQWKFVATKMNSPTSFNANYAQATIDDQPSVVWFRIQDDGANRIVSYSRDGVSWKVTHTIGRTDFLTADEVGFFGNAVNATYSVEIWLIHWVQS